jgi:thiamine-phosphate pyrophosphorylase
MKAYAIADLSAPAGESFYDRISALDALDADFIQLRGKRLDTRALLEAAVRCRELIRRGRSRFLVNGRVDVALASWADGVHLPADGLPLAAARRAGPHLMFGRSCHSLRECREAAEEGADYVLLGPLFPPRSKDGEAHVEPRDLMQAAALGVPVFALGGISLANLDQLSGSGAAGVAAITLFMSDSPLDGIMKAVRAA